VLGVDDAPHHRSSNSTLLTGVVYRGTEFIEDVRFEEVEVDGYDATERIVDIYDSCNNPGQIAAVVVDGVSVAGFNVVDIEAVASELEKPVIASTPNQPDRQKLRDTMERTGNQDPALNRLPEFSSLEVEDGTLYFQASGCSELEAEKVLRSELIHGLTPEPVRAAHMIGRGLGDAEVVPL